MNFCPECGFKLEGEFKFCPNCGSKLNSGNLPSNETSDITVEVVVCNNCGEENSPQNSSCFSCGIPLGKAKEKGRVKYPGGDKNTSSKKQNSNKKQSTITEEKVLDNKKILIFSVVIISVFLIALVASGVFESGIPENSVSSSETSSNSGINLANMEEITQLEEKVKDNPNDMESTLHLSHLLQDAGLYEKAITNYKKYLNKNPENADARVDMAICYYNLNDYNTAIGEMETAIKYQPSHQLACLNLGIVNLAAQNIDASKTWFRKTIELDPNSEAGKRAQELLNSH